MPDRGNRSSSERRLIVLNEQDQRGILRQSLWVAGAGVLLRLSFEE